MRRLVRVVVLSALLGAAVGVVTPVAAVSIPAGICQITYAGGPYGGPEMVQSLSQAACGTSTVQVELTVRIYRVSGTGSPVEVATGYRKVQGLPPNQIFTVVAQGPCTHGTYRYESRVTLAYDVGFRVITIVTKTVGPVTITC
jgi:hypothetical protein